MCVCVFENKCETCDLMRQTNFDKFQKTQIPYITRSEEKKNIENRN